MTSADPSPRRTADVPQIGLVEWSLLGSLSLIWGSSYLLIAIGLDTLAPGVVAWLRVALGAGALALVPASRTRVARSDWGRLLIVAIAGNAGPAILFALAEQTVESAVVGLITSATPIITLVIAVLLGTRNLRPVHYGGVALGFGGLGMVAAPNLAGVDAPVVGLVMAGTAVVGYGITSNVIVPLQRRYGGVAVIARALALSTVLLAPAGVAGIGESTWGANSLIAVVVLGLVGTGVARTMAANLFGRAGAARASVVGYVIPVVAVTLGVVFRGDTVTAIEIIGLGLALIGAYLGTRPVAGRAAPSAALSTRPSAGGRRPGE